ncbi:hypothetical protein [Paenibacillus glycinis]|uniref:hypothetical protein n=1 Tax=Paenibacillus glycinis TaxID=2697035 RepID=UPI00191BEECC|nr:hypothetical protein [Paenibacillus glycinis]
MTEKKTSAELDVHKKLAAETFNATWDLIEKKNRSAYDDDTMVNAAHASRYHWGMAGTPLHAARGEWLISRVYSLVGRAEPALVHAEKSLALCVDNQLGSFDTGFAYEALARAYAVYGDAARRDQNIALAEQFSRQLESGSNRTWLLKNVNTVASLTLPEWDGS